MLDRSVQCFKIGLEQWRNVAPKRNAMFLKIPVIQDVELWVPRGAGNYQRFSFWLSLVQVFGSIGNKSFSSASRKSDQTLNSMSELEKLHTNKPASQRSFFELTREISPKEYPAASLIFHSLKCYSHHFETRENLWLSRDSKKILMLATKHLITSVDDSSLPTTMTISFHLK